MNTNEKQNSNVLEDRGNRNQNSANENVMNEQFYGIEEVKTQNDYNSDRNDYDPIQPDKITNDEDDFLNSDYPEDDDSKEDLELDDEDLEEDLEEDDDDLEDQSENSFNLPGDDFNETEETIEDPDYDEDEDEDEDSETDYPEVNSRSF